MVVLRVYFSLNETPRHVRDARAVMHVRSANPWQMNNARPKSNPDILHMATIHHHANFRVIYPLH